MAAQNSWVGDGSTTDFQFNFQYLKAADIKASIDAAATTEFCLFNATTVRFDTAPDDGAKIKVYRETDNSSLAATFYAGSAIKSEDLNDNFTQSQYGVQEVTERYLSNLGGTMIGDLTMGEDADIVFEGATDDAYETTLTVADPTADRTITIPNVTGTVITTGDTGTVTSAMITDDTIVDADINSAAEITVSKLKDGTARQVLQTDSAGTGVEWTSNVDIPGTLDVTGNTTLDSALAVTGSSTLSGGAAVTGNITVSGTVDGRDLQTDGTKLDGIEPGATADQTNAEIRTAVEAATDSNVFTDADHTKLDGIEANATADQTAAEIKTAYESNSNTNVITDAEKVDIGYLSNLSGDVQTSLDAKQALDTELTTLSGMTTGTASKLAEAQTLTSDINDLNIVDGMTKQTTISDSDTSYPTSGAVVDYVAAQIGPMGGLEVIAGPTNFPASQPASGVVISISDTGGTIVVNGSGVATITDGAGSGNDVTINNFPSTLNSTTLTDNTGLLVSSTGSGHIYNYHKLLATESDVKALSDDINNFNERYRTDSSRTSDGDASNHNGDLFFDQGTAKMYVYAGTAGSGGAWKEVTSIGDFKLLELKDTDGTSPTYDGSTVDYNLVLRGTTTAASVTNAAQLVISLNGVVQKANAGTTISGSDEGFCLVDGDTIKFATGPAANPDIFVIQIGSAVTLNAPADNTVAEATIMTNVVSEEKLKISNSPQNGYFLQTNGSGTLTWAEADTSTIPVAAETTDTSCYPVFTTDNTGSLPPKVNNNLTFNSNTGALTATSFVGDGSALTGTASTVLDGCGYQNDDEISAGTYSIPAGKGVHSVGPITNSGTVTVSGRWVIS